MPNFSDIAASARSGDAGSRAGASSSKATAARGQRPAPSYHGAYLTGGTGAPVPDPVGDLWSTTFFDAIGTFDPAIDDEIFEADLARTAQEMDSALAGTEPLQWVGKENSLPSAEPRKSGRQEEDAPAREARAVEYFSLTDADLAEDPLFARLEECLRVAGLAIDDLPGEGEGQEMTEVLKELGFRSAIERTKLRKALRERRSWSFGVLDCPLGREVAPRAAERGRNQLP